MKISLNWLKKFAKIEVPNNELFSRIGARLVEIENVENLGEKYADVVVAKVVKCAPHPDSDHMSLIALDDGGAADEIISRNLEKLADETGKSPEKLAKKYLSAEKLPRDENGFVQVVCGAPNVRENLVVAWLPPTSIVPESFGTADEFRLDARKLRGILSYGMCASPRELDLFDEHDGILEVYDFARNSAAENENFAKKIAENHNSFAKIFELDDTLLEVENKSLTHRPDTFGIIGFARETAAILGEKMENPGWFREKNDDEISRKLKFVIIHGTKSSPDENWFPWLAGKLRETGHEVIVPNFPTPNGQNLESWLKTFREKVGDLDENTVLIGHSVGTPFILKLLNRDLKKPIRAAILVSAFDETLGADTEIDKLNETFVSQEFDFAKIRENAREILQFNSDNDPYIPLSVAEKLAKNLDSEFTIIENGGHINSESGYTEFPKLLTKIRKKFDENSRKIPSENLENVKVEIENPEICARYECQVFANFDPQKSTDLLAQTYLARSGMRPISSIVDVTNLLMLETGQPLHAFDYDKLREISPTGKPEILVRLAKNGEKLLLLDGREIELNEKDIVIAAGNRENSKAIGLAGAMGGAETEIDENTKNVLLESATFNLYNLRGTQFRHGIFSEAITRFTKGQPADLTDPVLRKAAEMFANLGANPATEITDNFAKKSEKIHFEIATEKFADVLGVKYSAEKIAKTLENLGYEKVEIREKTDEKISENSRKNDEKIRENSEQKISATAPWWRTDLKIDEDVIEDIGRVNGFDEIPLDLPTRKFTAVANPKLYDLQRKIREILKSFGANEVLTYSFLSEKLMEKVGQNPENSYKIVNSISPELQRVRQSLTPKMLDVARENLRGGHDNFALFEFGQVFQKLHTGLDENGLPIIENKLGFVILDKNSRNEGAFYSAKKYLTELFAKIGIADAEFRAPDSAKTLEQFDLKNNEIAPPFEPKRSAQIFVGREHLGDIGELKNEFREKLKLPKFVAIFEIDLDKILSILPENPTNYQPVPKFQGTSRDMTFQVLAEENFAKIENEIRENLKNLPKNFQTKLFAKDIFGTAEKTKNLTFHADFYDLEKTIDVKFVAKIVEKIAKDLAEKFGAKMI